MLRLSTAAVLLTLAVQSSSYRADIEAFRKTRAASIGADTGWAALTDLIWLDTPGQFTIGRAASNAIVLKAPSAPDRLGVLTVADRRIALRPAAGVRATIKGRTVLEVQFAADEASADGLKVDGMTMALIDREGRRALRVWDSKSSTRQAFHGLRWVPIDERWRIEARYIEHTPAPSMRIQNIVGQTIEIPNSGVAVFQVGGREYRLEALREAPDAEELFFMFRDGTSGKTTYGGGRYLYTPLPKNGRVTLDFNRAINPPCAFTDFATCPLPPPANRLSVAIDAGELDYKH